MKKIKTIFLSSSFVQNIGKLLSVNVLVQVVAFALSAIIARLYTDDDFGVLAKFMTVASIFIIMATGRLEYALILPKKDKDAQQLFSIAFLWSVVVAFINFIFLWLFAEKLNTFFDINHFQDWLVLMPLLVFVSAVFALLIQYVNRLKKYNQLAMAQAVQGLGSPLSVIGLHSFSVYGLMSGVLVGQFFASSFLYVLALRKKIVFRFKNAKSILLKYYRFPTYNTAQALVNNLSQGLPVLMLSSTFDNYLIGLFTMAIGKAHKPIEVFSNAIYQVFSKQMIDDLHEQKDLKKSFRKVLFTLVAIGAVPFILIYWFAPILFAFIWGNEWQQAGVFLQLLLPWLFMVYLVSPLSFIPNLVQRQKETLYLEIVYLIARFLALSYGVVQQNLSTALSAYAWASVAMLLLTLAWYYYIIQNPKNIDY